MKKNHHHEKEPLPCLRGWRVDVFDVLNIYRFDLNYYRRPSLVTYMINSNLLATHARPRSLRNFLTIASLPHKLRQSQLAKNNILQVALQVKALPGKV